MRDAVVSVLTVAVLGWVGTNLVVGARRALRRRSHMAGLLQGLRLRHVWPAPFVLAAVVATFVLLLLPALPLLVEAEERRFRLGAEHWSIRRRVLRGLQFGLLHLVVGIPLAAALALAVTGWWFTSVYLREYRRTASRTEALAESTRAHLGYNLVVIGLVAASFALSACGGGPGLRVTSPDFRDGSRLAERFACTGDNAVPTIGWSGAPAGTQGWAVVIEDPDAPTGTFTHWLVTGLGPATRSVGSQLPDGAVAGLTSSGQAGYVGPCPPRGREHRFRFRVHALREPLNLDPATTVTEARRRIESLSLDAAEAEVRYRTP